MTEQPDPSQCIFCKIIKGEINSLKVYEDEQCIAILDINPATKGHLLLIPKEHYQLLPQLPEEMMAHLGQVAKWLTNAAMKLFGATGVSINGPTGGLAGQNAPHAILHLIPRYPEDNIGLVVPKQNIPLDQLKKLQMSLAPKIKELLGFDINGDQSNASSPQSAEESKPEAESPKQLPPAEESEVRSPKSEDAQSSEESPDSEGSTLDDITEMFGGSK